MDNEFKTVMQLYELMLYVKENIEFYARCIPNSIYDKDEFVRNWRNYFTNIPIVNKRMIKSQFDMFVCSDIATEDIKISYDFNSKEYIKLKNGRKIGISKTSGSSGEPFVLFKDVREELILGRILYNTRKKVIGDIERIFLMVHRKDDSQYAFPFPYESDFDTRMRKELEYLFNTEYQLCHIHTWDLQRYCDYIESSNWSDFGNNTIVFENTGAFLSEEKIEEMSKILKRRITNYYGAQECWMIAYSCSEGYLHVCEDSLMFELVDDSNNVISKENMAGNIVLTSYYQRVMPIVRYSIGDRACYLGGTCKCGLSSKRIKILPNQQRIVGTKKYGTSLVNDLIWMLNTVYKIVKFNSIHVKQIGERRLRIYVCSLCENIQYFEECFIKCIDELLEMKFECDFVYSCENQEGVFSVEIEKE